MKFYKILSENEIHNGLQYKTGRVDDPNPFLEQGSCVPGGIYFVPVTTILAFINHGPWIREVTVPDDAQMVKDPGAGPEKYRASSVVLGEREQWEDPEVVRRLIADGADVHTRDDYALLWAVQNGHTEIVKILLEAGADVHVDDDYPLRWAAEYGHTETVRLLLEAGADVHAASDDALRWAAKNGHIETVKVLLEAGADVHADDDAALYWAARNGHTKIINLLEQHY